MVKQNRINSRSNQKRYGYVSSYASQATRPARPSALPKRHHSHVGVLFMLLLIIGLGVHVGLAKHASAHALETKKETAAASAAQAARVQALGPELNQILNNNSAVTMSISVAEVDSQASSAITQYGSDTDFDAASTGKLITAADYLHHVENGSASLSQDIDGDSAQDLLQALIVNSDDGAWLSLNEYLTHDDLAAYASSIGLSNYSSSDNELTSNDIALLLQKLYQSRLFNKADTALLLGYMQQANYRDYIIPAVPAGYTVYHKVGIDDDNVHDAAIIAKGNKAITLVIYTNGNGTYDWATRALVMQQITRDVITAYFGS